MTPRPIISVIVAVLNGEQTLHYFLQNVRNQDFTKFELIIIEGGSTDQTIAILDQYSDFIARLETISAVKMYPKLNEGIKIAKGEWLYFMGCDDYFFNDSVLQRIAPHLDARQYDYVSGVVVQVPSKKIFRPRPHTQWLFHSLHHQGTFYHRRVFEAFQYNENLHIAADYELTLRIFLKGYRLKITSETIACFSETGTSGNNPNLARAECADIRRRVYGIFWGTILNYTVHSILRIKAQMMVWKLIKKPTYWEFMQNQ